ncbi:MAG: glycosyltransferase family 4 protein [Actinomycetota bacterium]
MTEVQQAAAIAGSRRSLRVLMAVGAAGAVGGLEASFARIGEELRCAGVDASVLVVGPPAAAANSADFLSRYLPTHTASGWREIWRATAAYDVVHVHGATSALWPARAVAAARAHGTPIVLTVHLPSHPPRQPRWRGELRSRLRMVWRGALLLLSGADVYAPSAAAAAVARRQLRPWPVRVRGLWNGVVDTGDAPVSTSGPLRLVFVGRLADHKRPLEFVAAVITALSAGADVTADIVGDGPLRPAVEDAIAASSYADRFTLHGQCDDPSAMMRGGDLLVLTSTTEGCPLVAMEAAASGRGVLARAGIEGLAEGWRDAYVAVPDSEGSDGFSARIIELAADLGSVVRLGTMARRRFEDRFSAGRAAQALRAAYDGAHG